MNDKKIAVDCPASIIKNKNCVSWAWVESSSVGESACCLRHKSAEGPGFESLCCPLIGTSATGVLQPACKPESKTWQPCPKQTFNLTNMTWSSDLTEMKRTSYYYQMGLSETSRPMDHKSQTIFISCKPMLLRFHVMLCINFITDQNSEEHIRSLFGDVLTFIMGVSPIFFINTLMTTSL